MLVGAGGIYQGGGLSLEWLRATALHCLGTLVSVREIWKKRWKGCFSCLMEAKNVKIKYEVLHPKKKIITKIITNKAIHVPCRTIRCMFYSTFSLALYPTPFLQVLPQYTKCWQNWRAVKKKSYWKYKQHPQFLGSSKSHPSKTFFWFLAAAANKKFAHGFL